jgi:hypothetical protein
MSLTTGLDMRSLVESCFSGLIPYSCSQSFISMVTECFLLVLFSRIRIGHSGSVTWSLLV